MVKQLRTRVSKSNRTYTDQVQLRSQILSLLNTSPNMRIKDIAASLGCSRTTITYIMAKMFNKGEVSREMFPQETFYRYSIQDFDLAKRRKEARDVIDRLRVENAEAARLLKEYEENPNYLILDISDYEKDLAKLAKILKVSKENLVSTAIKGFLNAPDIKNAMVSIKKLKSDIIKDTTFFEMSLKKSPKPGLFQRLFR